MANHSMFDLIRELSAIHKVIEDNEGELTDELNEILTINKSDAADKISRMESLIMKLDADNDGLQLDIDKLQNKIKTNSAIIQRITDSIITYVKIEGTPKATKSKDITYSFQAGTSKAIVKPSYSMVVLDIDNVPDVYKKVTYDVPSIDEEVFTKHIEPLITKLHEEDEVIIGSVKMVKVDNKALKETLLTKYREDKSIVGGMVKIGFEAEDVTLNEKDEIVYAEIREKLNLSFS